MTMDGEDTVDSARMVEGPDLDYTRMLEDPDLDYTRMLEGPDLVSNSTVYPERLDQAHMEGYKKGESQSSCNLIDGFGSPLKNNLVF